ncbi:hypothetical protein [Thaumasiovibrio subtropicus]|uniref:hypothetical protein n=1 Tax=Thaumasiovibrio subtropicus TaxID=1891207 RepID=UPI000B3635C6|nr:hypothetical protein [Thaumasiovibrio subtropicus]
MFKCEIDCQSERVSFSDVEMAIGYVSEVLIPNNGDFGFRKANISLNLEEKVRDYVYIDAENLLEDLMNL